jgi:hypothetical protein
VSVYTFTVSTKYLWRRERARTETNDTAIQDVQWSLDKEWRSRPDYRFTASSVRENNKYGCKGFRRTRDRRIDPTDQVVLHLVLCKSSESAVSIRLSYMSLAYYTFLALARMSASSCSCYVKVKCSLRTHLINTHPRTAFTTAPAPWHFLPVHSRYQSEARC